MKKILLIITQIVHGIIIAANTGSFCILAYCILCDIFSQLEKIDLHVPGYISIPIVTFLIRLQFGNRCPLTIIENKLKN